LADGETTVRSTIKAFDLTALLPQLGPTLSTWWLSSVDGDTTLDQIVSDKPA
jgi:hypothetical protein